MLRMIAFLIFLFSLFSARAYAATYAAASCSVADISTAVTAASTGDTVTVPAGPCTWATQLAIAKSIILQGAGIGSTVITGNITPDFTDNTFILKVTPDATNTFKLTGFTFNLNDTSKGVKFLNATTTPVNIRVYNNAFSNCRSGTYVPFEINGTVYGVVDNNTWDGYPHFDIYGIGGGGQATWNGLTWTYGDGNKIYIEDNTITIDSASGVAAFGSVGHGGRSVHRYNTYTMSSNYAISPWFDIHGNQPSGVYAGMGGEMYGNQLTMTNNNAVKIIHHRGGKALAFFNKVVSSGTASAGVQEEYIDSISTTNYDCGGGNLSCASDGQAQHVSDSYYWSNYLGATLKTITEDGDCGDETYNNPCLNPTETITENTEYFNHDETFDGTTGVGCGTLASRPATCTIGVGYWATTQSCSDMTGMVGVSPTTPISGILYKCTATDTWSSYYAPYAYPHPLRYVNPRTLFRR